MIRELEEVRHAQERGAILIALKQGYDQRMVTVSTLAGALNMTGRPMTSTGMQFHLTVLADSGYIQIWRADELNLWRPDRQNEMPPDTIVAAKLMVKGLALIDGRVAADPQVTF